MKMSAIKTTEQKWENCIAKTWAAIGTHVSDTYYIARWIINFFLTSKKKIILIKNADCNYRNVVKKKNNISRPFQLKIEMISFADVHRIATIRKLIPNIDHKLQYE